ncbi:MAG: MBL fold metallo-hydrolase, partial [Phycisphaeraceae bacterium]|nr:MBL fold metallo-hydrolase [Phycisphaeraceae bacterium]
MSNAGESGPVEVPEARWSAQLLRAGTFKLDGGSMFGLIPRTVWSRSVSTDDRGRITVQHNCLLLDRLTPDRDIDGGKPEPKRVLVECGTGNKLDAKMREVFDLEDRWVGDALSEIGVTPESIDAVVVSHLHFDHAGGLTRLPRAGEKPDWVVDAHGGGGDGGGGPKQAGGGGG